MKAALAILCLLLMVGASAVSAGDNLPKSFNYQGYLTDAQGSPVPDGNLPIMFRIWDAATGGTAIWSETQTVTTSTGVYDTELGSVTPISLPFDRQYWLGIKVNQDPEMTPRVKLTSTPYCRSASYADSTRNSDMVDGYHVVWAGPGGAGSWVGIAGRIQIQVPNGSPQDLFVPLFHFHVLKILLACPNAAPQVGDVAYVDCVENDGVISCLGVDGSGAQVRMAPSLSSTTQILSVRSGHVTLSCPGDGSQRLKIHTQGEYVLGYILW